METITATIVRYSFVTKQPASIVFHLAFPFFELNLILSNWETNPNINRKNFIFNSLFPNITTGDSKSYSTDRYISNNVTSWIRDCLSYVHSQYEIVPSLIDENITISLNDNLCDTLEPCSQQCILIDHIESAHILSESPMINSTKEIEYSRFKELLHDDEIECNKNNCSQETLYSSALPEQRIESQIMNNEIDTCSKFYSAVEQQDGFLNSPTKFLESSLEKSRNIESSNNISHDIQQIEESLQMTQSVSSIASQECETFEKIENNGERCLLDNSLYVTVVPEEVVSPTKEDSNIPIPIERAPASLADIPLDIFIEICYHLPPNSLFALI
ncbi:14017_t:CDS:1, partial [Dentiscutata heterogama]